MASYQPPTENLPTFDVSVFSTVETAGLTIEEGNELYLRKTTPDTASALITFDAGISTNTIRPETSTDTIQIGGGFANSGDVSVNTGGQVLLTSTSDVSLNTDLGDINIGPVQSSGTLNIGTLANRVGAINIGTGAAATNAINIGSTTEINLGTTGTSVNVNGGINFTNYVAPNMSYLGYLTSGALIPSPGTPLLSQSTTILSILTLNKPGIYLFTACNSVLPTGGGIQMRDLEFSIVSSSTSYVIARHTPTAYANANIGSIYDWTCNLAGIYNKTTSSSEDIEFYVYLNYGGTGQGSVSNTAYSYYAIRLG